MNRPLAAFLLAAVPLCAAELELRYAALERILAEQAFSPEGRRYVRGTPQTKCQFAYLESPHLSADGERLRVNARFSGRSALDVFGKCMGLGDSFDFTVTAMPAARDGAIVLNDVQVSSAKDSFYIRRVRSALSQSFRRDFKIEVKDQARKLLEHSTTTSYQRELSAFDLQQVRVAADALVLVVDFRLVVK
jgi:hypothetical protein